MKSEVDKLDINKLVNIPTSLSNLKTSKENLDVGKLRTVPVEMKKLSDVVSIQVVKKIKENRLLEKSKKF